MNNTEISLLKKIRLFNSLTDEEVKDIFDKAVVKNFKKNEVVIQQEDTGQFMYIVLEGTVRVTNTTEDGKEIILALHKSGEHFGEVSLIDGKASPATVTAVENVTIAIISKKYFYQLLNSTKHVIDNLLQTFSSIIRDLSNTVELLHYKNAQQRIELLFEKLSRKYGKETDNGIILNIKLTHQDMADMSGLARQTVTKIIDEWKREQSISILEDKHIHLNKAFLTSKSIITISNA